MEDYFILAGIIIVIIFIVRAFIRISIRAGENSKDVLVCPKCGGTHKGSSSKRLSGTGLSFAGGISNMYCCKDCGYEGPFVLIDKEEVKNFKS